MGGTVGGSLGEDPSMKMSECRLPAHQCFILPKEGQCLVLGCAALGSVIC